MKPNRNISRLDTGSTHGYQVRLMRRGDAIDKLFSDRIHGGKRRALAAAREFRDKLEAENPHYSRQQIARKKSERNSSGVVGVRLAKEVIEHIPSKPTYKYWVAQWSPTPGARRTKRFSINKYGNDKAYRMAVAARKKGVREMES